VGLRCACGSGPCPRTIISGAAVENLLSQGAGGRSSRSAADLRPSGLPSLRKMPQVIFLRSALVSYAAERDDRPPSPGECQFPKVAASFVRGQGPLPHFPSSIQHPASSIQHPASSTQHPAPSTQLPALRVLSSVAGSQFAAALRHCRPDLLRRRAADVVARLHRAFQRQHGEHILRDHR